MSPEAPINDATMFSFAIEGFDIDAAFQTATADILADQQLTLDDKIKRMEVVVKEGTSDLYKTFVNIRAMVARLEMACAHDHAMHAALGSSQLLTDFTSSHNSDQPHDHSHPNETDPESKKKAKKRKKNIRAGWFAWFTK